MSVIAKPERDEIAQLLERINEKLDRIFDLQQVRLPDQPVASTEIDNLLEKLRNTPGAPNEHICVGLLWGTAAMFARNTEQNEFEFFDIAMRMIALTLAKLDRGATIGYVNALSIYIDEASPAFPEDFRELADQTMRANFLALRSALALAGAPEAGQA